MGAQQQSSFIFSFQALILISATHGCGLHRTAKRGYLMFMFSNLVRMVRVWRNYDKSLRELSRLGDRELADIGISRSDIQRIAWENARS
jgi:uncharacterized protein YjiS (DUF1127 family)